MQGAGCRVRGVGCGLQGVGSGGLGCGMLAWDPLAPLLHERLVSVEHVEFRVRALDLGFGV